VLKAGRENIPKISNNLSVEELASGVLDGDRTILARAVTLIESSRPDHQQKAQQLLEQLLPHTGNSIRVGISGVPGVGKSTFIESFGLNLINDGRKIAVLAVDPSSERTGGSILGDKTRMHQLSVHPSAFIRPSPNSGVLGGVSRVTRESILLCEAAGFDTILVETVGVGQSETVVASMVDFFLVLMLPGAGDDLQGIKRGVMEVADLLVVNKADSNEQKALAAKNDYTHAMRLMTAEDAQWQPQVLTCSALHNDGLAEVWEQILKHHTVRNASGEFEKHRISQLQLWLHSTIRQQLVADFYRDSAIQKALETLESDVTTGSITPAHAAKTLIAAYKNTE